MKEIFDVMVPDRAAAICVGYALGLATVGAAILLELARAVRSDKGGAK